MERFVHSAKEWGMHFVHSIGLYFVGSSVLQKRFGPAARVAHHCVDYSANTDILVIKGVHSGPNTWHEIVAVLSEEFPAHTTDISNLKLA